MGCTVKGASQWGNTTSIQDNEDHSPTTGNSTSAYKDLPNTYNRIVDPSEEVAIPSNSVLLPANTDDACSNKHSKVPLQDASPTIHLAHVTNEPLTSTDSAVNASDPSTSTQACNAPPPKEPDITNVDVDPSNSASTKDTDSKSTPNQGIIEVVHLTLEQDISSPSSEENLQNNCTYSPVCFSQQEDPTSAKDVSFPNPVDTETTNQEDDQENPFPTKAQDVSISSETERTSDLMADQLNNIIVAADITNKITDMANIEINKMLTNIDQSPTSCSTSVFKCPSCDFSTAMQSYLAIHQAAHHPVLPIIDDSSSKHKTTMCPHCDLQFQHKGLIANHLRNCGFD